MPKPEPLESVLREGLDHPGWCRECLSIRDPMGATVPLELWPAQIKLHKAIEKQRKLKKPVRIVYLKSRRVAVSAAAAAEIFHEVPFRAGKHAMIVAQNLADTQEIFDYVTQYETFYKPIDNNEVFEIVLPVGIQNDERKREWANGSYIRVATAGNLTGGRGSGLHYLQLDEFAFWRDARTLMKGLLQTVPDDAGTMVFVISTANGVGGPFHELWLQALSGESDWIPIFFAWWEHPGNVRALDVPPDVFQKSLGSSEMFGDEISEKQKYNLKPEQLNWRRWAIVNKCLKSLDTFHQEYPGCPEEAFLASGRPRFSHGCLGRMRIMREPLRGQLFWERLGTREKLIFLPDAEGDRPSGLAIYAKPDPHGQYTIGADVATGADISEGKGKLNPDWSVATVLDLRTGEQVAKFRERIEEPQFGEILDALGRYYNLAYLVPEANSYGRGVIAKLLDLQYPTSHIYQREREPDDRESASLNKLGFLTTELTRPQLISTLDMAIREFAVLIRDSNTLQECLTFVVNPRGRAEGTQDTHDDEVIALGLAVIGLKAAPRVLGALYGNESTKGGVVRYGNRRLKRRDLDKDDE